MFLVDTVLGLSLSTATKVGLTLPEGDADKPEFCRMLGTLVESTSRAEGMILPEGDRDSDVGKFGRLLGTSVESKEGKTLGALFGGSDAATVGL